MPDERFDDGLVHSHGWTHHGLARHPHHAPRDRMQANAAAARTPSTVTNDDLMFRD